MFASKKELYRVGLPDILQGAWSFTDGLGIEPLLLVIISLFLREWPNTCIPLPTVHGGLSEKRENIIVMNQELKSDLRVLSWHHFT